MLHPVKWFAIIFFYTVVTLLCVYYIPTGSILSGITIFFGFTFVAFVPGYCLINFLFQEGKLDLIEKTVLSVALSFSIAGISGLFLGLSSVGITVSSVTESLSLIVIILAVFATLRKTGLLRFQMKKIKASHPVAEPSQLTQTQASS
jgi:uncharacterized membrane protein